MSLKAEHYGALVRSRTGRLAPAFQAKFGWLLANLYGRAASPDWADYDGGKPVLGQLVKEYLEEKIPGAGPTWVDGDLLKAGLEAGVPIEDREKNALLADLESHRPKPRLERIVEAALRSVDVVTPLETEAREKIRARLRSNSLLQKLAKEMGSVSSV